jgi:hypothetical protein
MTLMEAMHRADALKPNTYSNPEKIRWLSILDGIIKEKIIDTHEGGENVVFNGYQEDSPLTTELLVPAPYDDIYVHWLAMQIDLTNGEYARYNNSAMVYNEAYQDFANYYNRTHMPLGKTMKYF